MLSSDVKIVVTGGAGFIGSTIVQELVERGYKNILVFDNFSRGRRQYIENCVRMNKAKIIEGDICDYDLLLRAIRNSKYVFHEAALSSNHCNSFPEECIKNNIRGTLNIIRAAANENVEKLLFASSGSIYGHPVYQPIDELHPLDPLAPYDISKLASEQLIRYFSKKGLRYIIFRYFNVYGPRQISDPNYRPVIPEFIKNMLHGKRPVIFGDGSQTTDFVHVRDIAQANILGMESDVFNEIFNVGTGRVVSIREISEIIETIMRTNIQPKFRPASIIVKKRQASIAKIEKLLGYSPSVNLKDGLKETVDFLKVEHLSDTKNTKAM